jgi:RNA polymerase sigma-70 factor, ECF subfamily
MRPAGYSGRAFEVAMAIDIEAYYQKYSPMVLRRCRFLLKDEDLALDAMQEVFMKLIEKKDSLHGTYPSSLLYTIATNICLNMIRSGKRTSASYDDGILTEIASWDEPHDQKLVVTDLIDRIFSGEKTGTREIAVMHYIDGMTLEQVAETSGLSVSGVRKRLRTLRERVQPLREELQ